MQPLVSSLSASDRLVQPLRKSFLSGCPAMLLDKNSRRMFKKITAQHKSGIQLQMLTWAGAIKRRFWTAQATECRLWLVKGKTRRVQSSQKIGNLLNILDARKVTRSKVHIKDAQKLGVIIHNLVATATCRPWFVHPPL